MDLDKLEAKGMFRVHLRVQVQSDTIRRLNK